LAIFEVLVTTQGPDDWTAEQVVEVFQRLMGDYGRIVSAKKVETQ